MSHRSHRRPATPMQPARPVPPPAPARSESITRLTTPPGAIGIPVQEWLWTQSAMAIFSVALQMPGGSAILWQTVHHSIAVKRNSLVHDMLSMPDLQWLLFIDSDAVPPVHTLTRLLSHNVDIVAATAYMRVPPFMPAASIARNGHGQGDLLEVDGTGCHCMLVRRRVLEALTFPWFDSGRTPDRGEDYFFCRQARKAGFKVYVDAGLEVGHLSLLPIGREFAELYQQTADGRAGVAYYAELGRIDPTGENTP